MFEDEQRVFAWVKEKIKRRPLATTAGALVVLFLIMQPGRYHVEHKGDYASKLDRWTGKMWISRGQCWEEARDLYEPRSRYEVIRYGKK